MLGGCNKGPEPLDGAFVHISQLSELGTVEYKLRKVIKANDVGQWYKIGDRKILFSCTAYVKAVIDLLEFTAQDMTLDPTGKHVTVLLPSPKILSLNIPSDEVQMVYGQVSGLRSSFTAEEMNAILRVGEKEVRQDVSRMGILDDAKRQARLFFTTLLLDMGYESVEVQFR